MQNMGQSAGNFVGNATTQVKQFAKNANTFTTQKMGLDFKDKKLLFTAILALCLLISLICMLPHSTKLNFKYTGQDIDELSDLFGGSSSLSSAALSEYYDSIGWLRIFNIILGFLPLLAASALVCIPFFTKTYKCGYLIFVRIMLFVDFFVFLIAYLILVAAYNEEASFMGVGARRWVSLTASGIFRLIFQVASIVLSFLLRAEIKKYNKTVETQQIINNYIQSQTPPMQ